MSKSKIINVTVRLIKHPNPDQAIHLFARLGLELYEKEANEQESISMKEGA